MMTLKRVVCVFGRVEAGAVVLGTSVVGLGSFYRLAGIRVKDGLASYFNGCLRKKYKNNLIEVCFKFHGHSGLLSWLVCKRKGDVINNAQS